MRKIIRVLDSLSDNVAKISHWLCVLLVLVLSYEVFMRYVLNSPTMWAYQTSMMIGATIYVLSWHWIHRHRGHIRIDVIYSRLSPRKQASIDFIGHLFLFLPFIAILTYTSLNWTIYSWDIQEKMGETYWLPPAYPLRTVVFIGLLLFAIQGLVHLYRDFYRLLNNKNYD